MVIHLTFPGVPCDCLGRGGLTSLVLARQARVAAANLVATGFAFLEQ